MSEQLAWNATLDASPEDTGLRLVYSDWLRDRGDPRADGYAAIGTYGVVLKRPDKFPALMVDTVVPDHDQFMRHRQIHGPHLIPAWWFRAVTARLDPRNQRYQRDFDPLPTRRTCEDALALAWSDMTEREQKKCHEFLTGTPAT